MPVYDYVCGACGHLLEVIHGIHAEGPRFCPSCGAEGRMTKALSAPAVVFKGSGWAKKDRRATASSTKSRTDASSTASKAGGSDASAAASKGESSGSGTASGSGAGSESGAGSKSGSGAAASTAGDD